MMMIAGPKATRNSEGKMKNTSGKISLMVVLAACLFHLLNALGSERVGMRAQGLADAGSELFGLDQHGDEVANTVHVGAFGQMLPGFLAGASGALFQHNDVQFIAKFRLRHEPALQRCAPLPGPGSVRPRCR